MFVFAFLNTSVRARQLRVGETVAANYTRVESGKSLLILGIPFTCEKVFDGNVSKFSQCNNDSKDRL